MKKIIAVVILFLFVLGACKEEEDPKYAQFNYYIKMQPSVQFDTLLFNVTQVGYDNHGDQSGWFLPTSKSAIFDLGKESQLFLGTFKKAGLLNNTNRWPDPLPFRHFLSTKNHWIVDSSKYTELSLIKNRGPETSEFITAMNVNEGDVVDVVFNLDVDKSVRLDSAGGNWIKWVGEVEMVKK
ncbi:hypothetical protein [Owenweeksia hongkongensis]|uniref:hypothetical protein n=1 Tax=Owenweeksia hongkongensis TaxID=253245 RepID=UPI003A93F91F